MRNLEIKKLAKATTSRLKKKFSIRSSGTSTFSCWASQKSELAGRTGHFDEEISFFQEFLLKNYLLHACYLGFD